GCEHSKDPNSPRCGTGDSPLGRVQDEHPPAHKIANEPGTLSKANTGRPNSGGAQFFINTVHNKYLDWFTEGQSKHPVFGRITSGMDVVKQIETTATGQRRRSRWSRSRSISSERAARRRGIARPRRSGRPCAARRAGS